MSFNNNYPGSGKSGRAVENDYANTSMLFNAEKQQNDVNTKEAGDRSYGIRCGSSQFLRSKRVALAACVIAGIVLAIGLVAVVALVVVVGLLNGQSSHLRSLQDEVAALRIRNEVLRNETSQLESQASVCNSDLLRVSHLLELSETKCGLEKANLSNHFQFEMRNLRADMEAVEQNLSECQEQKRILTDEKTALASDKASLKGRVDGCGREKDQLSDTVTQLRTRLDNARCPPCPSSNQLSYQRGNGADGLWFSRLLLFAILPAFLLLIR